MYEENKKLFYKILDICEKNGICDDKYHFLPAGDRLIIKNTDRSKGFDYLSGIESWGEPSLWCRDGSSWNWISIDDPEFKEHAEDLCDILELDLFMDEYVDLDEIAI